MLTEILWCGAVDDNLVVRACVRVCGCVCVWVCACVCVRMCLVCAFSRHFFLVSYAGKFVSVRGTVVRVGNIKPLVKRLAFQCATCGTEQVRDLF